MRNNVKNYIHYFDYGFVVMNTMPIITNDIDKLNIVINRKLTGTYSILLLPMIPGGPWKIKRNAVGMKEWKKEIANNTGIKD